MATPLFAESFDTLLVEESDTRLLSVTLNRPALANALNTRMGEELLAAFAAVERSPTAFRCIVLTGAGDRAFCAGADLKERHGMDDAAFREQHYLFELMLRSIYDCPVPIIAALNGTAMAGGLEIALACDFIYAADNARFGFPEVIRGIMPGGGGTQHLPRRVGLARAKEIILTGESFSAQEALDWGLVNRLFSAEGVLEAALRTAGTICRNAPLSVVQAKKAMGFGSQMDLRTGLFFEVEAYGLLLSSADRREGIAAFNEKRLPVFQGR